tara:strand:+ start:63 stop:941 length:879 start_codon:yes stop_codon:yes gene_type:complete
MDKPNCVINPKTNRAVKADSKLGKQILASQKKNVKKEPNQMYKKAIGPSVEDIPRILRKTNAFGIVETNKKIDDTKKSKIVDNMFWRKKLPTKEEINKMNSETLIMNMMDLLGNINAYVKLNVKLDKDDEANFKALYPTIELLIDQIDKLNINVKESKILYTSPEYERYQKYYNKYLKLRKKITGQSENKKIETETYDKLNIYPKKSSKPDYTKEGYFEDKIDLYNFLKSLVNLKPEVKNLYKKHKLDISTFIKKIHEMDKRIPPTSLLLEKLDYEWIDEFFKIFGSPPRRG